MGGNLGRPMCEETLAVQNRPGIQVRMSGKESASSFALGNQST